jgi:hypothetical protein
MPLKPKSFCSHRILGITDGITNLVGLKWDLLATLIVAWAIVYLIICKGLHASGKVGCDDDLIFLQLTACI